MNAFGPGYSPGRGPRGHRSLEVEAFPSVFIKAPNLVSCHIFLEFIGLHLIKITNEIREIPQIEILIFFKKFGRIKN